MRTVFPFPFLLAAVLTIYAQQHLDLLVRNHFAAGFENARRALDRVLPVQAHSELLFGLAEARLRLGHTRPVRRWCERVKVLASAINGGLKQARAYLKPGKIDCLAACAGCPAGK